MNTEDFHFLKKLLAEIQDKAFQSPLKKITRSEAKVLSKIIEQSTGLIVGAKSLQNYYSAVNNNLPDKINPNIATLDTLARYNLNIPTCNEMTRQQNEDYLYWYKYCEESRKSNLSASIPIRINNNKPKSIIFALTITISLSIILLIIFLPKHKAPYQESFDFSNPKDLMVTLDKNGWSIIDMDSSFLYKQDKPGYLTLYTLAGDYWIKPNENPLIKNLFVKKLDCSHCTIELSIKDFNPSKPWEQAGIFFLDENLSRTEFFRVSYTFALDPDIPAHIFQGVYGKEDIFDEIIRNPVTDKDYPKGHLNENNIWMKIQFDKKGNFEFTGHRGFEWDGYRPIGKIKLDFKPSYIALTAFHGFTFNTNEPLNGDTIPVYIDYIKITPP